jgi:cytolysin-activating lysine-acyltransferase
MLARTALAGIAGFAIWARASHEVDRHIRAQIKTGTFRVHLKAEDWTSGPVNWLLDVIAADRKATGQVIANFRQVMKEGDLRIHPLVAGLVDDEMRGKMMSAGAKETTVKGS